MATPAPQTLSSETAAPASSSARVGVAWLVVIAITFIALHAAFLRRMFHIATDQFNADWSHAAVLPFIAGWLVWRTRREFADAAGSPSLIGVPVMLAGIVAHLAGIYPIRNDMAQGYAMLVTLAGVVLLTFGTRGLRIAAIPLVILAMGVKISDRWWEDIAWRLQVLAANGAAAALQLVATDARVSGALISIRKPSGAVVDVNVAEACAGLRMLMSFIVLAVLIAFVPRRRAWQRFVLVALAVPVAVMVNILRVAVLGLAFAHDATWATGAMHEAIGLAMLVPALLLLIAIAWMLDRLFINATPQHAGGVDERQPSRAQRAAEISKSTPPNSRPTASVIAFMSGSAITAGVCAAIVLVILALSPARPGFPSPTACAVLALLSGGVVIAAAFVLYRVWPASGRPSTRAVVGPACTLGMLLVAAVGLGTAARVSGLVFYKAPVPLRQSFERIPNDLSRWTLMPVQPGLSERMIDELRTRDVLYRAYARDTQFAPRHDALLHLAYYTGTVDTVPHVPERCFLAQGFRTLGTTRVTLDLSELGTPRGVPGSIPATLFEYEHGTGVGRVIYFFIANGRFLAGPEELRLRAFDLRERTAYYCKVELTLAPRSSREESLADAAAFLREVLPSVMDCLPENEVEAAVHEARR